MTAMTPDKMRAIIEAALMVCGHPQTAASLQSLFSDEEPVALATIKSILQQIQQSYQSDSSGIQLVEVASGFRFQAKAEFSPWLAKLWEERAPRYSRAFLETLALIAYKQPITRAEIEDIRGVTVSSNIMKTLQEREWIRVLGHRDIPGKPAIYGTGKAFLDYFNLKSLTELPTLTEFKNLESQETQLHIQLALASSDIGTSDSEYIPEEREAVFYSTNEDSEMDESTEKSAAG